MDNTKVLTLGYLPYLINFFGEGIVSGRGFKHIQHGKEQAPQQEHFRCVLE